MNPRSFDEIHMPLKSIFSIVVGALTSVAALVAVWVTLNVRIATLETQVSAITSTLTSMESRNHESYEELRKLAEAADAHNRESDADLRTGLRRMSDKFDQLLMLMSDRRPIPPPAHRPE